MDFNINRPDFWPKPCVMNIAKMASQNQNFRTIVWTGCHMQMTLMCIPPCGEIGLEMHKDTDQIIRIEQGKAMVKMGNCKPQMDFQQCVCAGEAIFIPAGTWHNIINTGDCPLKVSSTYAPPNHPSEATHPTKPCCDKDGH